MGSIEVPMAVKEIIKMEERSPQNTKQYKTCDKSFEKEINLKIHNEFAQGHKKEEFPFQTENSEISSQDENFPFQSKSSNKGVIIENKDENLPSQDKNFPFQPKNSEISSKDENCLYPNIKNHRNVYSDKDEISGKKDQGEIRNAHNDY